MDETLQDHSIYIDESNVEDSFIVKVIQEVFDKNTNIVLNKNQIKNELYNILYEKYDSQQIIDKVESYISLIEHVDKQNAIVNPQLCPIIVANKARLIDENNTDNIDKVYDNTQFINTESLPQFLDQFYKLNRNNTNVSYTVTANKLYALSKPFYTHNDSKLHVLESNASKDMTAFYQSILEENGIHDEIKLIGPITFDHKDITQPMPIYAGDSVNIFGFFHRANEHSKEYVIVDFNKYNEHVDQLSIGDTILYYFNDFFPGMESQSYGKGTIKEIKNNIIHFADSIGTLHEYNKNTYNKYYIYAETCPLPKFSKQMLADTNIAFSLIKNDTGGTLLHQLICPLDTSEILYIHKKDFKTHSIFNLEDLQEKILSPYSISQDQLTCEDLKHISKLLQQLPKTPVASSIPQQNNRKYFSSDVAFLNYKEHKPHSLYKKQYLGSNITDTELNRFIYLKKNNDYGYIYLIKLITSYVAKKEKHIEKIKEKLVQYSNEIRAQADDIINTKLNNKSSCEPKRIMAKTYNTYREMLEDNNKPDIYFDEVHDKTRYDIKQKIIGDDASITPTKLKYAIMKELSSEGKLSKDDLEYETDSIMNGSRKVRPNQYAIVHDDMSQTSALYIYQNVQDKFLWIKVSKFPFKLCMDNLESFDQLIADKSCVYNTFDDICNTAEHVKYSGLYRSLLNKLQFIEDILRLHETFPTEAPKIVDSLMPLLALNLKDTRIQYFTNFTQEDHVDYEDYNGDASYVDYDKLYNNVEFGTNMTPVYTPQGGLAKVEDPNISMPGYDLLMTLIEFTDLSIDDTLAHFILTYNKDKNDSIDIDKSASEFKEKLYKAVNTTLYATNPKYKDLFDSKVNEKLEAFFADAQSKYYKSAFINITSMLIVVVMAMFPEMLIKQIIPKCVRYLSYMGYVSEPDGNKTLPKYFACLMKSIIYPSDVRLKLLLEMTQDEVESAIKTEVESILTKRYDLRTRIQQNAEMNPEQTVGANSVFDMSKYQSFSTFKPYLSIQKQNVNIATNTSAHVKRALTIIKSINEKVKSAKINTFNLFNVPILLNACCIESLSDNYNYYHYFTETLKSANKNHVIISKTFTPSFVAPQGTYDPPQNIFSMFSIQVPASLLVSVGEPSKEDEILNQNIIFKDHSLLNNFHEQIDRDAWWHSKFYPALYASFKDLKTYLGKVTDTISKEQFASIENKIIKMADVNNMVDTVQTLKYFINSFVSLTCNKLVDKYKINKYDKDVRFIELLTSATNNQQFLALKPIMKNIVNKYSAKDFTFESKKNNNIKQLSLFSYLLLEYYIQICLAPLSSLDQDKEPSLSTVDLNKLPSAKKDLLQLSANIVVYLIDKLCTKLKTNDNNIDSLKGEIEMLREKRKQELMNRYKADEEERALQMQLKKIGLQDWSDVGTVSTVSTVAEDEEPNKPTTSHIFTDEAENLMMYNNYGENNDDDYNDDDYDLVYDHTNLD